jgi:four helix bundle protein
MLRIHDVAVKLIADVMPMVRAIDRVDPDLARQLRKAVMAAPLNIAEGSMQAGKRRSFHYRVALGTAREAWSALLVANAAEYIAPPSPEVKNRFDHVIGTLHRCVKPAT